MNPSLQWNEEELIAQLKMGNLQAFDKLYFKYQKAVYQNAFKLTKQERYRRYILNASIYGALLGKAGNYDSAVYYTEKGASYLDWKSPVLSERYFTAAQNTVAPEIVIEQMKTAFRNEGYTTPMKSLFLTVYNKTGKTDGKAVLNQILNERKEKLRSEMRGKMVSTPSPQFKLAGLKGGDVSLASLKGKVILLDFWATWCTPCIASFPSMQRLVDANKNNPDVVIFFVDTWQKEENKFEVVTNFFKDKSFSFDVLMDLKDEVVKSFNITGIPTKVIIDKKGVVRFISVGFNSDEEKGIEELQAMIDVAAEL